MTFEEWIEIDRPAQIILRMIGRERLVYVWIAAQREASHDV